MSERRYRGRHRPDDQQNSHPMTWLMIIVLMILAWTAVLILLRLGGGTFHPTIY